jgi:hypothetical protein
VLKVITVSTDELEFPDGALRDILEGVREGGGLLAHSAAVIQCPAEYLIAGFAPFLAGNLGFPFLGCTTSITAVDGAAVPSQLTMMILTSDSVRFRAGMTDPLRPPAGEAWDEGEIRRRLDGSFLRLQRELTEGFAAPPSLAVPFLPWIPGHSDQTVGEVLFARHQGLPFFGSKAADLYHAERENVPLVVCNGESAADRAAMLVAEEGLRPRFFLADILRENVYRRKALITEARGNALYEVNHKPVEEFITGLGLEYRNLPVTLNTTPVVLFSEDQAAGHHPRVFMEALPDGGLLFNGPMPEGMSIAVAVLDADTIAETARSLFGRVASLGEDIRGAMFFSCLSRHQNLVWDELREIRLLEEAWEGVGAPWIFSYSAGEICPRTLPDGGFENSYLQFTTSAMAL